MSDYYCNEDARNLVELEIKNRKEALELYSKVIEVVEKFDGKVLNKRFETALKKVDSRLSYEREHSRFKIKMNVYDSRSCKSVKKDSLGYSCTNYIYYNYLTLNSYVETYTYDKDKKSMLDNERIVSSVLIDALNKGKTSMEEHIKELEESLDKVTEWKEKLESLKSEMEKTMREIPYLIKEYYNLDYSVRKY